MESSPASTSASTPAASSGHRNCIKCRKRIADIKVDRHTQCLSCRSVKCDFSVRCDECRDWSEAEMADYLKHRKVLLSKSKKAKALKVSTSKVAGSSSSDAELSAMKEQMSAMMTELRNQLASVRELNTSFAAPSEVSLQGGLSYGTTSSTLSLTASSNARPRSIPPAPAVLHDIYYCMYRVSQDIIGVGFRNFLRVTRILEYVCQYVCR